MLETLLSQNLFAFFLIFVRLGAALMVMPGFGEIFISPRIRLLLALVLSFIALPILEPTLPAMPSNVIALVLIIMGEVFIGLFFGLSARILFSTLSSAGVFISFQSGLANALVFDPNARAQGAVIGAFLGMMGMALIFVTNLHHLIIEALFDSYDLFKPAEQVMYDDMLKAVVKILSQSFMIALKIAMPFIIVSLIINTSVGLLSRLMPQMQVYFVMLPVQIFISFLMLAILLSTAMLLFWEHFEGIFAHFALG